MSRDSVAVTSTYHCPYIHTHTHTHNTYQSINHFLRINLNGNNTYM